MFYHLLFPLHQTFSVFNVFRYLTFRTAYAALTALLVSILVGPYVIRMLQRLQVGQVIRQNGPKSHYSKAGTPTMGGLLILGTMALATLLWANLTSLRPGHRSGHAVRHFTRSIVCRMYSAWTTIPSPRRWRTTRSS